jgi:hypothetical protein
MYLFSIYGIKNDAFVEKNSENQILFFNRFKIEILKKKNSFNFYFLKMPLAAV